MNRYYLPSSEWQSHTLCITGEEARHATRVMRVQLGAQVEIIDGCGKSAVCIITHIERSILHCEIQHQKSHPAPQFPVTLCQSIPKGGNMELIVQKAVELGVNTIQPLITQRTVARPDTLEKKQAKWQRIALEACKQCGQNYLPKVAAPLNFQPWISQLEKFDTSIIASLDDQALHLKEHLTNNPLKGSIALLIGPEGDFSPDEYTQAYNAGFQPISFGGIIMRVETASIYGLSVIQHEITSS